MGTPKEDMQVPALWMGCIYIGYIDTLLCKTTTLVGVQLVWKYFFLLAHMVLGLSTTHPAHTHLERSKIFRKKQRKKPQDFEPQDFSCYAQTGPFQTFQLYELGKISRTIVYCEFQTPIALFVCCSAAVHLCRWSEEIWYDRSIWRN
jgi:hypothetical protein